MDRDNPPFACRMFGHRFERVYAYGNEAAGHVLVMCKRRSCGHIARQYYESAEPTRTPGSF